MQTIETNENVSVEPEVLENQDVVDPSAKWKQLLGSRKFWAALIGLAVVVIQAAHPEFNIDQQSLAGCLALIAAYILGTGIEDGLSRK